MNLFDNFFGQFSRSKVPNIINRIITKINVIFTQVFWIKWKAQFWHRSLIFRFQRTPSSHEWRSNGNVKKQTNIQCFPTGFLLISNVSLFFNIHVSPLHMAWHWSWGEIGDRKYAEYLGMYEEYQIYENIDYRNPIEGSEELQTKVWIVEKFKFHCAYFTRSLKNEIQGIFL